LKLPEPSDQKYEYRNREVLESRYFARGLLGIVAQQAIGRDGMISPVVAFDNGHLQFHRIPG
jgi:hypothetical protein